MIWMVSFWPHLQATVWVNDSGEHAAALLGRLAELGRLSPSLFRTCSFFRLRYAFVLHRPCGQYFAPWRRPSGSSTPQIAQVRIRPA